MEVIGAIALGVLAIVGAATSRQIADEFKAWSPWIVGKTIRCAVRQLPEDQRERFSEEWHAHVNDIPGDAGKLIVALGFLSASWRMSSPDRIFVFSKRLLDLALSIVGLAFFSPLFIVAAAAIKIESRGPVLFRQTRRGFNNDTLQVFKFRTMRVTEDDQVCSHVINNDSRVTWIGRWLRLWNVDELPQLINVLLGQMSIVGPRPVVLNTYPHDVKPGITGWAQVNGYRGETDTLEKMQRRFECDLFYAHKRSILLDLKIILMTLFSRRARKGDE
jgi:lipopolysaccharide/colanic/teichoic acid biosynthesis glycosyltransferase